MKFPKETIESICLSYRHDYGLLGPMARANLRTECANWIDAILHNGFAIVEAPEVKDE